MTVGYLPAMWRVEDSGVRCTQGNQLGYTKMDHNKKMGVSTASVAVKMDEIEGLEKY